MKKVKYIGFSILLLTMLVGGMLPQATTAVHAATINVPGNVTDLVNAINTANGNGQDDILELQAGFTYNLTAPAAADPDGCRSHP